ncbi:MAG: RNA-directed DNA polymerase [Anaerolineales bacterium]
MALYEQLCEWDNLWFAWRRASCGKRGRGATAAYELYLGDHLVQLQSELQAKTYQPGGYESFYIHEPKKRLISAAPFADRVAHHALCNVITPILERRFIPNSFANRLEKGTHRAIDQTQAYARRYRYYLQCDVVQFFPSIDHAILQTELSKSLPDDSLNWLIDRILVSGASVQAKEYNMVYFDGDDLLAVGRPRGLPIGNLTSQWWANAYLNPFDHFVRRELGCTAYLRYVDDFILFSNDKDQLWRWRTLLVKRMANLRLMLHEERCFPRPTTDGIGFLGFVIYPGYRLLKRRKGIAYQRKLAALVRVGKSQVIKSSVQGWLNHVRYADTWGLRRAVLARYDLLGEIHAG